MATRDALNSEVRKILQEEWRSERRRSAPRLHDLELGNHAIEINGTVLYADLNDSTKLVDGYKYWFAAEVYKSYLVCAARLIQSERGVITAYDGDRIMSVFCGERQEDRAVKAALKINYAVNEIINPAIAELYSDSGCEIGHAVGIDKGELFVALTGVREFNDLVWVGRAANYAAKLTERSGPPLQITAEVYNQLSDDVKYTRRQRQNMWSPEYAWDLGQRQIYTSTYRMPV